MEKLKAVLKNRNLGEITDFINSISPDTELKKLKCKKDIAIDRAVSAAETARAKRNKRKYRKISRRLKIYC